MSDRVIRSGLLTSDSFNQSSWLGQLVFIRLIIIANDYGLVTGDLDILRDKVFPNKYDVPSEKYFAEVMGHIKEYNLIKTYTIDQKDYIAINKFQQRIRLKVSKIPHPIPETIEEWLTQLKDQSVVKKWLDILDSYKSDLGTVLRLFMAHYEDEGPELRKGMDLKHRSAYDADFHDKITNYMNGKIAFEIGKASV